MDGVHFVRSTTNRWYVYAWRGGPRVATIDGGAKPRLSREIEARIDAERAKAGGVDAATLSGLIRDWHRSPEWKSLAKNTRDTWTPPLNRIDFKWGEHSIELWNDPRMVAKVLAWRDSLAATPRAADIAVTVLSRLLEWGRLRARIHVNVASGVPNLYRGHSRAEIIWLPDDILAFYRSALILNAPEMIDALDLDQFTGFRLADLAAVNFREVGDHAIVRTALKKSRGRRRRAVVPKLPQLATLIEELRTRTRAPGVETLLVNSYGKPWAADALGKRFSQVARHAGIVHLGNAEIGEPDRNKHLHDVRGTFVTHLCRAGLTDEEIAGITAWSPANVAQIRRAYVDDAAVVVALSRRINAAL